MTRPDQTPEAACDICGKDIFADSMCLTDIDMGPCHAECLEGSPCVDLETGDRLPEGAPAPQPYRFGGDSREILIASVKAEVAQ